MFDVRARYLDLDAGDQTVEMLLSRRPAFCAPSPCLRVICDHLFVWALHFVSKSGFNEQGGSQVLRHSPSMHSYARIHRPDI